MNYATMILFTATNLKGMQIGVHLTSSTFDTTCTTLCTSLTTSVCWGVQLFYSIATLSTLFKSRNTRCVPPLWLRRNSRVLLDFCLPNLLAPLLEGPPSNLHLSHLIIRQRLCWHLVA